MAAKACTASLVVLVGLGQIAKLLQVIVCEQVQRLGVSLCVINPGISSACRKACDIAVIFLFRSDMTHLGDKLFLSLAAVAHQYLHFCTSTVRSLEKVHLECKAHILKSRSKAP